MHDPLVISHEHYHHSALYPHKLFELAWFRYLTPALVAHWLSGDKANRLSTLCSSLIYTSRYGATRQES